MSNLADLPKLVGFFSYSRGDDIDSGGKLSGLRAKIDRELATQLGRDHEEAARGPEYERNFRLWQDKAAIQFGTEWEAKIREGIKDSVFFIPIVTPRAVKSPKCKFEFESFLIRETSLCRRDLIFPILYVRVPELEKEELWRGHEVLEVVATRQYPDWRGFRQHDAENFEFAKEIEKFCASIVEALGRPWSLPQASTPLSPVDAPKPIGSFSPSQFEQDADQAHPKLAAAADSVQKLVAETPEEEEKDTAPLEKTRVDPTPAQVSPPGDAGKLELSTPQKAADGTAPAPDAAAAKKSRSVPSIFIGGAAVALLVLAAIVYWGGWSTLLTIGVIVVGLFALAAASEHPGLRNLILLVYFGPLLIIVGVSLWNWVSGQQYDVCSVPYASYWLRDYSQICDRGAIGLAPYEPPQGIGKN